jgi:hypothetical protein
MAAPVLTIQVALNWSETAIRKDDSWDCQQVLDRKNRIVYNGSVS